MRGMLGEEVSQSHLELRPEALKPVMVHIGL